MFCVKIFLIMTSPLNIQKLAEGLTHEDSSVRRKAAQELAGGDARAIYPLLQALRDENPGVQDAAIRSLVAIGGEVVAYMLIPLLREDSFLRNTAQLMLRDLGSVSIPMLYPLLQDKDDDIRKFALDVMGEIATDVDATKVIPMLADPNANVRASAIKCIGLLGYTEGAKHVENALGDEEWVAFTALDTLGQLGVENSIDAIMGLLSSNSQPLRYAALETLGSIGSPIASDALVKHIMSASDEDEKSMAINRLVKPGDTPSMREVADILMGMLKDAPWEDKLVAIQGLADLKEHGAVPLIIDITGSLDSSVPDEDDRLMAIKKMIEDFGPSPVYAEILRDENLKFKGKVLAAELAGKTRTKEAVPALIEQLDTDIRDLRSAAAKALGIIGSDEARKALIGLIHDPESNARKMAITCLGYVPHPDSFEPLLKQLDEEPYNDVLEEIIKSLLEISAAKLSGMLDGFKPQVREAVARFSDDLDILLTLSRDEVLETKLAAISSLGELTDRKASERVVEAIHDSDPEVRRTSVIALGSMDVSPEALKPLLNDSDMWVRVHAVRNLGHSLRQDMVETLSPLLNDKEIPVVLAAIEALTAIGGKDAFTSLSSIAEHADESVQSAAREALERF